MRARNNVRFAGVEDGPTIMLAHGFGCDQHLWRLVEARLASSFRVVLFDHVGSGASDPSAWDPKRYESLQGYADDILGIVHDLDLHDVTFVGHSVAAMMGVLAVATDPSRFARLVLLTPSPCYLDQGDYRGGFSRNDIDELLDSLESNYLGWSRSMAPVIMGTPDRPELGDELTDSFCRTDPACARVFARTTFLSDNRADLARVSLPTLVIECAHDTLAPREVGAYVQQQNRRQPSWSPLTPLAIALSSALRTAPQRPSLHSPARRDAGVGPSESAWDLYENAPCGYVVAGPDRSIVSVNATLLAWLGYERNTLTGTPFTDLLAVGSLIHYETHFAPLLQLQGQLAGVTVDLVTADGGRLPVFVTANVKS